MFKRLRILAQIIGFVVLGLLAFSGAVSLINSTNPVAAALGLHVPQAPQALEPSIVSYQGMLYDDLGAPLSGEYDLTFRLYDDPVVPVSDTLWTETLPGVTVRDGRFSVLLGDTTPIDYADFAQANTYMGIQVGTYDELVPRQRFASVPYAFYATRASGLSAPDGAPADAVTVDNSGNVNTSGTLAVAGQISSGSLNVSGNISGSTITGSSLDVGSGGLSGGSLDVGNGTISGGSLSSNGTIYATDAITGSRLYVGGNIGWSGHLANMTVSDQYDADSDAEGSVKIPMVSISNSICFLTQAQFENVDDTGEPGRCDVQQSSGNWELEAYTDTAKDASAHCEARCLQW